MAKKKVLIVDDSSTVRQHVSEVLSQVGFEVLEAVDGQVGVEVIERESALAVVICDVNMPRMDGIELLTSVKSQPKNASLPILMLTTDGQSALIRKAKAAGARGWMVKPFNPVQLVAAVQKLAGA